MRRLFPILLIALLAAPAGAAPKFDCSPEPQPDMDKVRLGRLLFYDPVLSGSRTVSCATCHSQRFGTSDGVSLGIGDGGIGVGPERRIDPANPPEQRVPRNATALFNLGRAEFSSLFADGRVEKTDDGLRTPVGPIAAPIPLTPLAAQAMFPVTSPDEMAGHYHENDISAAVRKGLIAGPGGAWALLAARVAAIPEYRTRFDRLIGAGTPIHFAHVADAMAAFMAFEWRADDSPYDRWLCAGAPLDPAAARGLALFDGAAGCADCHSGRWQTDQSFHAVSMPQIGPGKAERFETHARDLGRMRVTGRAEDAYRFRTPSLRNIADTAPYGHAGAYATLEAAVRHHLDPVAALYAYDRGQAALPPLPGAEDFRILDDASEMAAIAAANELAPRELTDAEVADILAFLDALTDPAALAGRLGQPETVPSGLPVE